MKKEEIDKIVSEGIDIWRDDLPHLIRDMKEILTKIDLLNVKYGMNFTIVHKQILKTNTGEE